MSLPEIDTDYLLAFLADLLNTPSPTGFASKGIDRIEKAMADIPGWKLERTRKGALLATLEGERNDKPVGLSAHTDTLGAMVKEVKSNGRLRMTQLGGFSWTSIEGEGCTVFTNDGKAIRGSILIDTASAHVYGKKVSETPRDEEHLEVRLDARTTSSDETRALGIRVGDCIALDPRVEITNGFVRSRHLDDKACVACMVEVARALAKAGLKPRQTTYFLFSTYEEVGHGAVTGFPPGTAEMVVVDMAVVGQGQTSDEFSATVCVKDAGGPYDQNLSNRFRHLAEKYEIPYKVDIYPFYASDGTALLRAGADMAVALVGPGVDASHSYERTHTDALIATTRWVLAYLLDNSD
jgi:putative aminopeptidase FrvX